MPKNVFIVGAAKSGTSTLHEQLDCFSEVSGAKGKEPHFYCNSAEYCTANLVSYDRLFSIGADTEYLLDSSTGYFQFSQGLPNLKLFAPEAKIIVLLRNPIDRFISHYNWLVGLGEERRCLKEVIDYYHIKQPAYGDKDGGRFGYKHYGAWGLYGENMERVYTQFPASQVKVIFFEHFISEPVKYLCDIRRFLGLREDEDVCTRASLIKSNKSVALQYPNLLGWLTSFRFGMLSFVIPSKVKFYLRHLKNDAIHFVKSKSKPIELAVSDQDRQAIHGLYQNDIDKLVSLLGLSIKELPWDDFSGSKGSSF